MLTEAEIRAAAQKVVDETKATAHVDTGALRRSISYTYVRNIVTFRELFYGKFNDNAQLEKNANRYMPVGVQWRIIYTNFGGDTYEVGKTKRGRKVEIKSLSPSSGNRSTSNNARNAAKRAMAKRILREQKDDEENGEA